jgi:hypothetical protein
MSLPNFAAVLADHGAELRRAALNDAQVNVGKNAAISPATTATSRPGPKRTESDGRAHRGA